MAAAFHRPEPDVLDSICESIRVQPDRFLAMEAELAGAGSAMDRSDALTRMPKGFDNLKGSQVADAIRLRSFMVRRDMPLEATTGPGLVNAIVNLGAAALPMLRFGWAAVDEAARA